MNENTYKVAKATARTADVGAIGLDDVILIADIIYYGFEFWKSCHQKAQPTSTASQSLTDLAVSSKREILASVEGDGRNYSKAMLRKASVGVRKAARFKHVRFNKHQVGYLTGHMLNQTAVTDHDVLVACYCEPEDSAVVALEGQPDENEDV